MPQAADSDILWSEDRNGALWSGLAAPAWADARSEINAGNAASNSGDLDAAIAHFTKAIELEPDNAGAYCRRGVAYDDKGLHDQAIADFTKAIELKPDLAGAYNNRGVAYDEKGLRDQAFADYTKAIKLKPDLADATTTAATCIVTKSSTTRPSPITPR